MTTAQKRAILLLFTVTCIAVASLYFTKTDKSDIVVSDAGSDQKPAESLASVEPAPPVMYKFDLETAEGLLNTETIADLSSGAFSGTKVCRFTDKVEYGVTILRKMDEYQPVLPLVKLDLSFRIRSDNSAGEILAVCSVENKEGQSGYWQSFGVTEVTPEWTEFKFTYDISQVKYDPESYLKVYIWNKSLSEFDTDDYIVSVE